MPVKHIDNTPITKTRYYVIYLKNLADPRLFPVMFISKAAAKRAIRVNIPKKEQKHYFVIRGKKLIKYRYKYLFSLGVMSKFTKYTYPDKYKTRAERKSYRTLMRRRLRRMGMLTLVKSKQKVSNSPQIIKLIKNTQEIANSPNTLSKAIRLERKPKHYYYIILKKEPLEKKGYLWELRTIRVDTKNQKLKSILLKIKRSDVIIPHLITEILNLYYEPKTLMDKCRKAGFKIDKGTGKSLHKKVLRNLL